MEFYQPTTAILERASRLDISSAFLLTQNADGNPLLDLNPLATLTQAQADARYSLLGHTHTFASLTSKPTTIGGYGITDFNSLGDARWLQLTGGALSGAVTSTLSSGAGLSLIKAGDANRNFLRWKQGTANWQAGFRASPYSWVLEWQSATSPTDDTGWLTVISAATGGNVTFANNIVAVGGYVHLRATTSTNAGAIRNVSGTLVECVVGDGSAYANFTAQAGTFNGLITANSGLSVTGAVTLPLSSISDSALTSNIPRINAANTFTGGAQTAAAFSTGATAGNGYIVVTNGGASNIGYIEWRTPAGVRQGYMGFGSSGINLQMENGSFTINANVALHYGNRDQAWSWTTVQTFSPNALYSTSSFTTSYTSDGVWNANAAPSFRSQTPAGNWFRVGYHDAGGGEYIPSIGFGALSTNYSPTLLIIQSRIDRGTPQSNNKFQINHAGGISWGPGTSAVDTSLARVTANNGSGALQISGSLIVGSGQVAQSGDICSARDSTSGVYYFGASLSKYLYYDSANFSLSGGSLNILAGAVVLRNTYGLYFNNDIAGGGGGPRMYGADNVTLHLSGGAASSTTAFWGFWINGFGSIGGYLYTDGTNFGLLSKNGNWGARVSNTDIELYHNTQIDGSLDVTGAARQNAIDIAKVIITTSVLSTADAAPASGVGTIKLRVT